jgi:chain length determinant protein EpsF
MTIRQLLLILLARFRLIAAIFATVVLAVLVASLLWPRQYTAVTAVVVDARSADPVLGSTAPAPTMPGYVATQVDIIGSTRVASRVVALTKIDQLPRIRQQWLDETTGEGSIEVWLAEALRNRVEIKPARESSVISIGYPDADPELAARIANGFAQAYIDTVLELKVEPARQYAEWFDERTGGLRDELEGAQRRLSAYEQEHGIITGDGRFDVENARLSELASQLVVVQGERAESRSRQSEAGAAESMPEVMQNPLISGLKADSARLEAQRQQMRGRFGRNHPEISRLDAEIASLHQRIASETRRVASSLGTSRRISDARESEIAAAVEAQRARVIELKSHRDRIAILQRDVENAQRAYDQITQRLAQTSLESQTRQTNVSVLTVATAPTRHSSPRLVRNLAIAGFLGALLGLGAALLLELASRRIRSDEDLAGALDLPVLASLDGPGPRRFLRLERSS